jgi:predicted nuclease of predicted toxin-antitoxin system
MNFLIDECVYYATTQLLRTWKHDVLTAQEAGLAGKPDEDILAYAVQHERVLITIDMDFSNIRRFPPKSYAGIIVLKIRPRVTEKVHKVLQQVLRDVDEKQLNKTLVIIDQSKYRVR